MPVTYTGDVVSRAENAEAKVAELEDREHRQTQAWMIQQSVLLRERDAALAALEKETDSPGYWKLEAERHERQRALAEKAADAAMNEVKELELDLEKARTIIAREMEAHYAWEGAFEEADGQRIVTLDQVKVLREALELIFKHEKANIRKGCFLCSSIAEQVLAQTAPQEDEG